MKQLPHLCSFNRKNVVTGDGEVVLGLLENFIPRLVTSHITPALHQVMALLLRSTWPLCSQPVFPTQTAFASLIRSMGRGVMTQPTCTICKYALGKIFRTFTSARKTCFSIYLYSTDKSTLAVLLIMR